MMTDADIKEQQLLESDNQAFRRSTAGSGAGGTTTDPPAAAAAARNDPSTLMVEGQAVSSQGNFSNTSGHTSNTPTNLTPHTLGASSGHASNSADAPIAMVGAVPVLDPPYMQQHFGAPPPTQFVTTGQGPPPMAPRDLSHGAYPSAMSSSSGGGLGKKHMVIGGLILLAVAIVAVVVIIVAVSGGDGGDGTSPAIVTTDTPTVSPSPTSQPTWSPISGPTISPRPTRTPTFRPSPFPTPIPTRNPTGSPTPQPTLAPGPWQLLRPKIVGEAAGDRCGEEVALSTDGNVLAVTSATHSANGRNSGRVRVFVWTGSQWNPRGQPLDGANVADQFGIGMALSGNGNTLAVGARLNDDVADDAGQLRVYNYNAVSDVWVQFGVPINGEERFDYFGFQVAISDDGSVVATGSSSSDRYGPNFGFVRVYEQQGGELVQRGQDIAGMAENDSIGTTVALSADGLILAVGGRNTETVGVVRTYTYNTFTQTWTQLGQDIVGQEINSRLGNHVALSADGSIMAIGEHDFNDSEGQVRVYEYNNATNTWVPRGDFLSGEDDSDNGDFGFAIALSDDGNILAVGERGHDGNALAAGNIRVYEFVPGGYVLRGQEIVGERRADEFGYMVALSGDGNVLAGGALYSDDNGENSGNVRVFTYVEE